MNLRFVEAFIVVTRLKSFRAAADKLHTTQPAISSRIAALEEELGVKLFERNSRAVTLTPQGSALLPLAESMLVLQQQMAMWTTMTETASKVIQQLFEALKGIIQKAG